MKEVKRNKIVAVEFFSDETIESIVRSIVSIISKQRRIAFYLGEKY